MIKPVIGIIGAGKLGITLGNLAVGGGYTTYISASGSVEKIQMTIDILVPGAFVSTNQEISEVADIIILALPLSKYKTLKSELFKGKIMIDAMNYWWEVDGTSQVYSDADYSSSERVQDYFTQSKLVKAFNHIGYHNLADDARLDSKENRKVVLVAGNDQEAVKEVEAIIEQVGFDPLSIGPLKNGRILEPGFPLFGASLGMADVKVVVNESLEKIQ
ncbi:NADPH-dependent F420 reductase [Granulicatella seriolae]|uniref:NADPH-dependent F420 reductase n=1 Tax=Granulicatella seriolae TaxID=2967226 RepID=A0ABT1WPX1_9LACT|nr:NADPH-dependent F420 reductase [Granulicatella seriolae]